MLVDDVTVIDSFAFGTNSLISFVFFLKFFFRLEDDHSEVLKILGESEIGMIRYERRRQVRGCISIISRSDYQSDQQLLAHLRFIFHGRFVRFSLFFETSNSNQKPSNSNRITLVS